MFVLAIVIGFLVNMFLIDCILGGLGLLFGVTLCLYKDKDSKGENMFKYAFMFVSILSSIIITTMLSMF